MKISNDNYISNEPIIKKMHFKPQKRSIKRKQNNKFTNKVSGCAICDS